MLGVVPCRWHSRGRLPRATPGSRSGMQVQSFSGVTRISSCLREALHLPARLIVVG